MIDWFEPDGKPAMAEGNWWRRLAPVTVRLLSTRQLRRKGQREHNKTSPEEVTEEGSVHLCLTASQVHINPEKRKAGLIEARRRRDRTNESFQSGSQGYIDSKKVWPFEHYIVLHSSSHRRNYRERMQFSTPGNQHFRLVE